MLEVQGTVEKGVQEVQPSNTSKISRGLQLTASMAATTDPAETPASDFRFLSKAMAE